jgi:endonuclease/exonuclease/phosphatase family metal-dependent hydrolase
MASFLVGYKAPHTIWVHALHNLCCRGVGYKASMFTLVAFEAELIQAPNNQIYMLAALEFHDRIIAVGSTHLKATKTKDGEKLRVKQIQTFLLKSNDFVTRTNSTAFVLAGDLNAQPGSVQFHLGCHFK